MNILIFHDNETILGWLCEEPLESAPEHIRNGYPHLQARYDSGEVRAAVIQDDGAGPEGWEIVGGIPVRTT